MTLGLQQAERQRKKPRESDTAITKANRKKRRVWSEIRPLEKDEEEGDLAIGMVSFSFF